MVEVGMVEVILAILVVVLLYIARGNEQRLAKQQAQDVPKEEYVRKESSASVPASAELERTISDGFVHKRGSAVAEGEHFIIGSKLQVPVRDIHFTKHKCKIKGEPPTMAQMLKWTKEQFHTAEFECARWYFGGFACWAAEGNVSNRMLYVMNKLNIDTALVTVVKPPEIEGDDYPETAGNDFSKIQLIP